MKVHELLDRKEKWTRRVFARDEDGHSVDLNSNDAVRWCLSGAITYCYSDRAGIIEAKVRMKLGVGIVYWNDVHQRTFKEVRALALELDI